MPFYYLEWCITKLELMISLYHQVTNVMVTFKMTWFSWQSNYVKREMLKRGYYYFQLFEITLRPQLKNEINRKTVSK